MRSCYLFILKAPEFHIDDTFKAIQAVYEQLVDEVGAENIVVGDGTGGALALSFVQSLIKQRCQCHVNCIYCHHYWMLH